MQVDSPVDGTVAVDVGMLNEELGGALEVVEEPLIEVDIERPAVPAAVELDCPEQRQFVKHFGVDARVCIADSPDQFLLAVGEGRLRCCPSRDVGQREGVEGGGVWVDARDATELALLGEVCANDVGRRSWCRSIRGALVAVGHTLPRILAAVGRPKFDVVAS
jgi:hypothetical protein